MGQRSQIFIKIHNPVKASKNSMSKEENAKAKKMFGNGKYTVIALHHQWLYGRSAVVNVKNMLDITNKDMIGSTNPFSDDAYIFSLDEYIKRVMSLVQVQFNPLHPRGIGIENMHFLNDECIDENGKYSDRWDIRKDFTLGDNNDGVTIIDTIKRKYCLMNIFTYDVDDMEDDYKGVYNLPSMIPCSALEYATAYYNSEDDVEENKKVCNLLSENEVLSLSEVKKLFPKSFNEIVVG